MRITKMDLYQVEASAEILDLIGENVNSTIVADGVVVVDLECLTGNIEEFPDTYPKKLTDFIAEVVAQEPIAKDNYAMFVC